MSAAIGADLGGTKMAVGVVDEGPEVLWRSTETTAGRTLDELMEALEHELRAGIEACPNVEAIGLGVPSTIDRKRGVAVASVNLPIADVPVRDLIAERIGLPTFMDNDANLAALAEHRFGAGRGTRNLVLLTIGTGIGGGLVLEGEPFRGSGGAGAELGHVVIDENGPRCQGNCPNHGCVEALASGTALGARGPLAAADAPGFGPRARRWRRTARSPAGPSPRRRWRATGSRSRSSPASAATLAWPWRATPTSSTPT